MSKKNQDNEICIYDSEEIAIKKIYKKHKKVIEKVKKEIFKQVEKEPFKNYYEINICDFSPQEMQAIKYYFVNWCGFYFRRHIPENYLYDNYSYYIPTGINAINTNVSVGISNEKRPIEKFYICWFIDNKN